MTDTNNGVSQSEKQVSHVEKPELKTYTDCNGIVKTRTKTGYAIYYVFRKEGLPVMVWRNTTLGKNLSDLYEELRDTEFELELGEDTVKDGEFAGRKYLYLKHAKILRDLSPEIKEKVHQQRLSKILTDFRDGHEVKDTVGKTA